MLNHLKQKYMSEPSEPESLHLEVTLSGVTSVLLVLAGGMGFSLIVMLGEKLVSLFRRVERKLPKSKQNTIYSRKMHIRKVFIGKKKHATSHSQLFVKRRTGRSNIPAIEFYT